MTHWPRTMRSLQTQVEEMMDQQKKAREAGDIGTIEKHGVSTGQSRSIRSPARRLPIWVANYILADYGTGAIMSVPAHDERDYEFATKYGLAIRIVVLPRRTADQNEGDAALPYSAKRKRADQLRRVDRRSCDEAQEKMAAFAEEHGFGKTTIRTA